MPRPFLRFTKKDASNLFWLPMSNATRLDESPFSGQSARSCGRNERSIVGSGPLLVKLYSLFLNDPQDVVPRVCAPVHRSIQQLNWNIHDSTFVHLFYT